MQITPYHAKYFAYELTKRSSSNSLQKLASSLLDAQVDLNPHQVEAALFAFKSPLSKGAILADEVGLGKTIEAGIVISQKWAERKKKILIIVPSNLRKQWNQELLDKFFLSSIILETPSFNQEIKKGNLNPFEQEQIVICSYHFARTKEPYLTRINWDLVVIDEAHRLRNVYKPTNKISNAIKRAVSHAPKILLTATPLQNSLLELYGLVSIIDDYTFGDLQSYKNQFSRLTGYDSFDDLKDRLKPVCKRTLRRQVLEYIKFTNRLAITQEFIPSPEEQKLYDLVSSYLQRNNLYALPASQRQLMTLILRRLLASSTFAIAGTLEALAAKLETLKNLQENQEEIEDVISQDFEAYNEVNDEWIDEKELEDQIEDRLKNTRQQLLETFDEEVHEKLRVNLQESRNYISKYENWLWQVTLYYLEPYARFDGDNHSFTLIQNPFPNEKIHPGPYRIGKNIEDANIYRIGHPLAQRIIEQCKIKSLPPGELIFNYTDASVKISILEPLIKKSGWLSVSNLTIHSFETEDYVLLSGISDDGLELDAEQCRRFFSLPASVSEAVPSNEIPMVKKILQQTTNGMQAKILQENAGRNSEFFDIEMGKLEKWADDVKGSLEIELKALDKEIKFRKTEARKILNLEDKVKAQRHIKDMEKKRNSLRMNLFQSQDEVDVRKEKLIEEIEARLKQKIDKKELFVVRWKLI
ncbi:MAG: hypothetical protein A2V65_03405 [Deltaproteobacteria bacterium RBG_13_49_15]|nr:MAG: hypothetical protein A2V65_03405 [Deltaproteobacteria bacterium RBG_13_49_15]